MPDFSLTQRSGSHYALTGRVNFANAARLHDLLVRTLSSSDPAQAFTLDLAGLTQLDTSLLALLLALSTQATARKQTLVLTQPPAALCALAQLSEAEDLLPLQPPCPHG